MQFTNEQLIGIGVVALLAAWYLKNKTVQTVKDVGNAVNPVNPDNVINGWFNEAYQSVTGSEGTLGTDLADYFNGVDG